MVAHVPLSWVLRNSATATLVFMLAIAVLGLREAAQGAAIRAVMVLAFVAGWELLWRASGGSLFWEFGKYYLILVSAILVTRFRLWRQIDRRGLLMAAALAPSLLVLPYFDREEVAFNVSGPVSLALAAMMFVAIRLDTRNTLQVLATLLCPIVGLLVLSTFSTVSSGPGAFMIGGKATTAGIGPNQVSALLGLGMMVSIIVVFVAQDSSALIRRFYTGLAVAFGLQCLLSFSRGGLWGSLGAVAVMSIYLVRNRRARNAAICAAIVRVPLLNFVIIPAVDGYSRGMAVNRFQDTGLTGRDRIMQADFIAFTQNPVLGIGPGQSKYWHALTFRVSSAHTEYTRLLAEHGSLGILFVVLMLSMAWSRWRRRASALSKALAIGFTVWTLLYLGHSAMRLMLPSFVFALGGAALLTDSVRRSAATPPTRTPASRPLTGLAEAAP